MPSRFLRLGASGLLALAAAGLCACGSADSSSSSGEASLAAARARPGPEAIFQADPQLRAAPMRTLAELRRLGVERVRVYVPWAAIAPAPGAAQMPAGLNPTDPSAYGSAAWAVYDRIVRAAHRQAIALDLLLSGPAPLWATRPGSPPGPFRAAWEPSASAFGAFVRAIGRRYDGRYTPSGNSVPLPRVSFWSIWNEPNYGPDLAPQAVQHSRVEVSPRLYRGLLDAAWRQLHRTGHGGDTILIGELAPRGITAGDSPGNFSGMVPLRFVRALYCVDEGLRPLQGPAAAVRGCPTSAALSHAFAATHPALFHAAGFSVHPYPQGQLPPDQATAGEPDFADLAALPRLEWTLDRALGAYGDTYRFPLYSTEFGYQTDPPERISRAAPVATAAAYLNWSEYISWRDPRIRSYDQYLLRDPPGAGALGGFATGLDFAAGRPKPTYAAYRMPLFLPRTVAGHGHPLEVWGCVRPAAAAAAHAAATPAQIQFSWRSDGSFRTLRVVSITNPHGYFDVLQDFPASGYVRLRWRYPDGTTIYSRTLAITIR